MLVLIRQLAVKKQDSESLRSAKPALRCLFAILIAGFAMSAALAATLVIRMDRLADAKAAAMIGGAVETRAKGLAFMTRDYGRWDDAVEHLYGKIDVDWANTNLANATDIFIFDQDGNTLFSAGPDGSKGVDLAGAMPDGLHLLLKRLPKTLESSRASTADAEIVLTYFRGHPAIFTASPIQPFSDNVAMPDQPIRYVGLHQPIDRDLLSEWGTSFGLLRMRWLEPARPSGLPNSYTLRASYGDSLGDIVWDPASPGRTAAMSLLPYFLAAAALFLVLWLLCANCMIAMTRALYSKSNLAENSAREAAANLEIARLAQIKAEAAQLHAEELAVRANQARREAVLQQMTVR